MSPTEEFIYGDWEDGQQFVFSYNGHPTLVELRIDLLPAHQSPATGAEMDEQLVYTLRDCGTWHVVVPEDFTGWEAVPD